MIWRRKPRTAMEAEDFRLIFEMARDRLATQLNFADALETKIGLFLSTGSVLIGALAAFLALHSQGLSLEDALAHNAAGSTGLSLWDTAALIGAGLAYLWLAFTCGRGLLTSEWWIGQDIRHVEELYRTLPTPQVEAIAASTYFDHYTRNSDGYRVKVRAFRGAYYALVAETVLVFIGLVLIAARV